MRLGRSSPYGRAATVAFLSQLRVLSTSSCACSRLRAGRRRLRQLPRVVRGGSLQARLEPGPAQVPHRSRASPGCVCSLLTHLFKYSTRFYLFYFFFLRFCLFIHERQREREAETQAEGEVGPTQDLMPGLPGSRPGPEADAQPLSHRVPLFYSFLSCYSFLTEI